MARKKCTLETEEITLRRTAHCSVRAEEEARRVERWLRGEGLELLMSHLTGNLDTHSGENAR
jgi:hypothetical protein